MEQARSLTRQTYRTETPSDVCGQYYQDRDRSWIYYTRTHTHTCIYVLMHLRRPEDGRTCMATTSLPTSVTRRLVCEGISGHATSSSTRRAEKNSSDRMTARRKTLESTRFETTTCRVHAAWTTRVTKQHMRHQTTHASQNNTCVTKQVSSEKQAYPLTFLKQAYALTVA